MKNCTCNRFYNVKGADLILEYAFSGSLCRIREFKTFDGLRYCLSIFSLSDHKRIHYPHDEYAWLVKKLLLHVSPQAIHPTSYSDDRQKLNDIELTIQHALYNDIKIKCGKKCLTVGIVTAFGLVRTAPRYLVANEFLNDVENVLACDPKWDICTCKNCPVFSRLREYELIASVRDTESSFDLVDFYSSYFEEEEKKKNGIEENIRRSV